MYVYQSSTYSTVQHSTYLLVGQGVVHHAPGGGGVQLQGGQLDALGGRRGGVHGLQQDLHRHLQVLVHAVVRLVVGLQNALSSLVVLAW
jgi:hypothetical protein